MAGGGTKATADGAETRSRLEFWRYPDYMAQFPFAHTIEMIHRFTTACWKSRR